MTSPDEPFIIQPRQTVDVIDHPEHGRCRAVYANGPRVLVFDDGTSVEAPIIGRSWSRDSGMLLDIAAPAPTDREPDPVADRVRCPILAVGDAHERAWSPRLGEGWLVAVGGGARAMRFEGDDGAVMRFHWMKWDGIDSPARRAMTPRQRKRTPETDEDRRWGRYTTVDGEGLVFRSGGAPPPPAPDAPPEAHAARSKVACLSPPAEDPQCVLPGVGR